MFRTEIEPFLFWRKLDLKITYEWYLAKKNLIFVRDIGIITFHSHILENKKKEFIYLPFSQPAVAHLPYLCEFCSYQPYRPVSAT